MDNHHCIFGTLFGTVRKLVSTIATTLENLEAEPGIEPGLADLQSDTFPLQINGVPLTRLTIHPKTPL